MFACCFSGYGDHLSLHVFTLFPCTTLFRSPDYHLRQSIAAAPHLPCCLSLQYRSEDLRGHYCIITHLTLADICRRRPLGGGELFAAPLGDRGGKDSCARLKQQPSITLLFIE